MKLIKTIFLSVLATLAVLSTTACSPTIVVDVHKDLSGTISFKTETGKIMTETMQSMLQASPGSQLFDKSSTEKTLAAADLHVQSLIFPNQSGINLTAQTEKLTKLLSGNFITIKTSNSQNEMTVCMNPQVAKKALSLMPQDNSDYIELLMAPLFTGEIMNDEEYIELIAAAYGAPLSKELKNASMFIQINTPTPVKTAVLSNPKIGSVTIQKNKALFILPLAKILTDTAGTNYTITW